MRIAFQTHTGMVRGHNEDSVLVDEGLGLFVIADGLGGHLGGEVASAIAVQEVRQRVLRGLRDREDSSTILINAILAAHEAVSSRAQCDEGLCDMGTTIVAALLEGDSFIIGHVGNSRAYIIEVGAITPITKDHSFVAEWIEEGLITSEQARTHKARHGLTMAVGIEDEIEPVLACVPVFPSGALMLCSDGLTEMLADDEIQEIVEQAAGPAEACKTLVDTANRKGGTDNISVVLIDLADRHS